MKSSLINPRRRNTSFVDSGASEPSGQTNDIDLVPMINVVFLLLIFFMIVGVFRTKPDTGIVLPEATSAASTAAITESAAVLVRGNGDLLVNNKPVSSPDLFNALSGLDKEEPLIVNAAANAAAGQVLDVLTIAADAGFLEVRLEAIKRDTSELP